MEMMTILRRSARSGFQTDTDFYRNGKLSKEELSAKMRRAATLMRQIADLTAEVVSPEQMNRISGYLNNWDNIGFDDRRLVADGLISAIRATGESAQIEWRI
jgi:hypothetical protein